MNHKPYYEEEADPFWVGLFFYPLSAAEAKAIIICGKLKISALSAGYSYIFIVGANNASSVIIF